MTLSFSKTFPNNNVKVSFKEFEADSSNQIKLRNYLIDIEESSPSDASIAVSIEKNGPHFKGTLQIFSQKKNFVEEHDSEDVNRLMDQIFTRMGEKIQNWKKSRFKNIGEEIL